MVTAQVGLLPLVFRSRPSDRSLDDSGREAVSLPGAPCCLLEVLAEEVRHPVEGDLVELIIKIR